jgi:hypothetical protein
VRQQRLILGQPRMEDLQTGAKLLAQHGHRQRGCGDGHRIADIDVMLQPVELGVEERTAAWCGDEASQQRLPSASVPLAQKPLRVCMGGIWCLPFGEMPFRKAGRMSQNQARGHTPERRWSTGVQHNHPGLLACGNPGIFGAPRLMKNRILALYSCS